MATITCRRCKRETEGFDESPLPGPFASEIVQHACPSCFDDWMATETMIINEYRLDLGLARSQDLLNTEMARFLSLPSADDAPASGPPPQATPR